MSFDIFFQQFEHGEPVDVAGEAISAVLDPFVRDRSEGWARLVTAEGTADAYGLGDPTGGLMINHASGKIVWDVMFDLASAAKMVILPTGCGTFVCGAEARRRLPAGRSEPVRVVASGTELRRAVESS